MGGGGIPGPASRSKQRVYRRMARSTVVLLPDAAMFRIAFGMYLICNMYNAMLSLLTEKDY